LFEFFLNLQKHFPFLSPFFSSLLLAYLKAAAAPCPLSPNRSRVSGPPPPP
jgi:hypothetical protein